MDSEKTFADLVADAYEHLYDLVHLRTHPLADALIPDASLSSGERALHLHRILLNAIDELDPGPGVPAFTREWRRHRLLVLRYVQALEPEAVASQISVSPRHFYRLLRTAVEAVACVLRERQPERPTAPQPNRQAPPAKPPLDGLELLRLEAARMAQSSRYVRVAEVLDGVCSLLQERLASRALGLDLAVPESLPSVSVDQGTLRQMMVGVLGYLIERAEQGILRVGVQVQASAVCLYIRIEPPAAVCETTQNDVQQYLTELEELAVLSGTRILTVQSDGRTVGFDVRLPVTDRAILVVDDNEDVLELVRSYLSPHQYRVVTAQTAQDALEKALKAIPYAITIDLMMPDQDGWHLLQTLLNQPETRDIPVIVCSVLKQQKDLALSLGATAFLGKPVTEQALLSVLQALEVARDGPAAHPHQASPLRL